MLNVRALTLVSMVLAAAATRIIPHPWNFTAVGAMCLFGGAYFQRRWAAIVVPLAALVLSDLFLAATVYGFTGLSIISVSHLLFALTACLGMTLRGRVTFSRVTLAAVTASILFFLLSNFAAWMSGYDGYPYTPAGLLACYIAAVPFAQNMLLANLFYSGVLFGGWELLSRGLPALRQPKLAESPVRR